MAQLGAAPLVGERAGTVDGKGLKAGALGLVGSVVVGMASTAPAYSLVSCRQSL